MSSPVVPIIFGSEQKGMKTGCEVDNPQEAKRLWLDARDNAVRSAEALAALGVHKSICNRLTEPFMWITVLMTATEWKNFFRLRCHPDAEVHFQLIAGMIRDVIDNSVPKQLEAGEWHLPFINFQDREEVEDMAESAPKEAEEILCKWSTARCARLSYLTHEGERNIKNDFATYDKLVQGSGFGHWCYDKETEVLTDNGWMSWPDAYDHKNASNLKIATVSKETSEIHFEKPSSWHSSHYRGEMYCLKGNALDLLVTPEHNMLVAHRKNSSGEWSDYRFVSANEVCGKPVRYLKSGYLEESSRVPTKNPWGLPAKQFAALVAFFIGDGNAEKTSKDAVYFNLRVLRKIEYLKTIFPSARRTLSGKWVVEAVDIAHWFRENCYTAGGEKKLPGSYLYATDDEFLGLMEGFKNSDGSKRSGRESWHYDTTSTILVGQFQTLLHLNGMSSGWRVSEHSKKNSNWKDCYRLEVSSKVAIRVEMKRSSKSYSEEWKLYDDVIYCATVSTGCLMVRRNGRICVSGNSPMGHPAQALADGNRMSGPFRGFLQYRKMFVGENIEG